HEKAVVRLAGLTSLEHLGQEHPEYRQMVVDVLCAYLRSPFQPSTGPEAGADDHDHPADNDTGRELQVRSSAQQILCRHLMCPSDGRSPSTYWGEMAVDLTGAHLVDFDFTACRPGIALFTDVRFSGD